MISQLIFLFLVPLFLSLMFTPFVIQLAKKVGALDLPNERKVHKSPIPRFGGIAIYVSFFLSLVIYYYYYPGGDSLTLNPKTAIMLVVSLTLVLILGVWDDLKSLSPGKKFIGQCLAAAIVYFAGFRISAITSPFNLNLLDLGLLDFPATILWVVGITNAFNLIDGLDGLASGVALIVSFTICSIAYLKGDMATVMIGLILAGSIFGFLRYNFNNARIFLGDSGSLFIGFLLAILSMISSTKGSAAFSILVPVLALGLPIMDTMLSMVRRFFRSFFSGDNDSRPIIQKLKIIFHPDSGHIHHQLIAMGFSHKKVVLLLYVVSCAFGIGAFAVTVTNNISTVPILIAVGIATYIGISQLHYREMAVLRNGILLPLYERPFLNSNFFHGFLDLAFIIAAFTTAYFMTFKSQSPTLFDRAFFKTLMLISSIRIIVFYLGGLYKSTFRNIGMADLLKIFQVTLLSAIITWTILAFFPKPWILTSLTFATLDFYFLLSLTLGVRLSFQVLNFLSRREQNGKRKLLIYGAGNQGALTMQQILGDESMEFSPIGFIDDNPRLEGKRVNGFPIFGGHWKIQRLINTKKVAEIIIATESISPRILSRLIDISRKNSIHLRQLKIQFEECQTVSKGSLDLLKNKYALVEK